jgi:hypothetical protein
VGFGALKKLRIQPPGKIPDSNFNKSTEKAHENQSKIAENQGKLKEN